MAIESVSAPNSVNGKAPLDLDKAPDDLHRALCIVGLLAQTCSHEIKLVPALVAETLMIDVHQLIDEERYAPERQQAN